MLRGIRGHHARGRPILAECGGMLYLLERLSYKGVAVGLAGVIPGGADVPGGLRGLGLMGVTLPEGRLRGHSFHHSTIDTGLPPIAMAERQDGRPGPCEGVFRVGGATASFLHFYFPSNPEAVARLLSGGAG
jgi:cobyrinic acid a,c-diamide synthase